MRLGIQKKMVMSLSIFLLTIFTLSCWGIISYTSSIVGDNIKKQQFAMTELIAGSINEKLGGFLSNIAQVSLSATKDSFSSPENAKAYLESVKELKNTFNNGIMLFDSSFMLLAEFHSGTGEDEKSPQLIEFLKTVQKHGLADISNPYISSHSNAPAIAMAVPIIDSNDKLLGMLVGSINLTKDYFFEEIMSYKIGKSGYLYLFTADRTMILHPDKNRIMKKDFPLGANMLLDRAIEEKYEGSGETVNTRGMKQIASFKRLRVVDWILGVVYTQDEAYQPIKRLRTYLITSAFLVTLLSVALIWLLTNRVTADLKNFTAQVRRIRETPETSHEISVNGKDEVFLLADTFNGLMRQLDQSRESLEEMTRSDHLTGLFNRRHFAQEAPKLIELSKRQNTSTAVVMVDIDHFKRINDTFGHDTGDDVLVFLATTLRNSVRPYDLVTRHGGEEFLLLLPLITEQHAMDVSERIRNAIQTTPVPHGNDNISITVSMGVYVSKNMDDIQNAITRADTALYEAKNSGRNRICLAPAA